MLIEARGGVTKGQMQQIATHTLSPDWVEKISNPWDQSNRPDLASAIEHPNISFSRGVYLDDAAYIVSPLEGRPNLWPHTVAEGILDLELVVIRIKGSIQQEAGEFPDVLTGRTLVFQTVRCE